VIALFKRLPTLRWRGKKSYPPVSKEDQAAFPDLKADFAIVDEILLPIFIKFDQQAMKTQNWYWLSQLVLIFGGMLATILGALQAVLSSMPWPGIVEALLAVILTTVAEIGRERNFQSKYFHNRVTAEVLRGEYFQFLGRLAPYDDADEAIRRQHLEVRVQKIESEGDA